MRSSHAILLLQDHIAEKGCSNISGGKSHGDISTKDTLTSTEKDDILLMASTLYTMAFNQGHDCMDSLRRLMNIVCERLYIMGMEIPSEVFFRHPVVQILLLSME
mmetsp:Transcript_15069/g.30527  ORF Transcript_15069/g.30527 Transcript_15069/m.30527 type:complete len:105 (+) Transcript_15069:387-701(+)